MALHYARRAVELEDDPALWGRVVAQASLSGALLGAGLAAEAVDVLRDAWRNPVRSELPTLLMLQAAGQLVLGLVEIGELDEAREISAQVAVAAAAAERAWGDGAAAAIAVLRLGEARLVAAHDPAAALPLLHRTVALAEGWGRATVVGASLTSLAAAQWATGDRAGARTTIEHAREAARTDAARPLVRRQLDELEARIGRGAGRRARGAGPSRRGAHRP